MTGAAWAVCLMDAADATRFLAVHHLPPHRREELQQVLVQPRARAWLGKALFSRKVQSFPLGEFLPRQTGQLFVFPPARGQALLLVKADQLDETARRLWRLLAVGLDGAPPAGLLHSEQTAEFVPNLQGDIPYNMPRALESVLAVILSAVPCQAGWLATQSGDLLQVRAQSNCPRCLNSVLSFEANELLESIHRSLGPVMAVRGDANWVHVPRRGTSETTKAWVGFPLVIGQRPIGLVTLWRELLFTSQELDELTRIAARVSPTVEIIMTFNEMSNHLQRLGMLNDFALTVSSAQGLDQIVRRVFAMLQRTFRTELVTLFLLSADAHTMREYRNQAGGKVAVQSLAVTAGPLAQMVLTGKIMRLDDLPASGYPILHDTSRSALVVPLRYRGQLIGTLHLESPELNAFSVYDENLMVVIASHLAGLVEYGRLREDAEARARNLGLIHEVVEQVVGLTNKNEVARIAADLTAQYFAYELASIALTDEAGNLAVAGIGGSAAHLVQAGLADMDSLHHQGITGRVFRTGSSLLVPDVSQHPNYRPIPGWAAGSEMCVALKDGDRVLGIMDVESTRKNAFTSIDLLALESMAGILAGVITSADQYQRLQATIRQLRTTQQDLQTHIEAQRIAESRLVQAAKLAAVGEMAAGIAHELNNPLTTVTGFVELVLQDMPLEDPRRADLEMVLKEAHRARNVVRRLLDFSRQSESVRDRLDLNDIITDVISLMRHLVHTSGIQLQVTLGESLPWVSVDRNQVKQVLVNLFHNALQSMPEGGSMLVATSVQKRDKRSWVTVSISDTGVGIPPQDLQRIFEPFFTTKAKSGGTGLGLSVTYGIVTDHGGTIDVESQPGKGSRFTVFLPV